MAIRTVLITCLSVSAANAEERIPTLDFWSVTDPQLEVPRGVAIFPDAWRALWRDAFTASEEDLRREAAESILRAFRNGVQITPAEERALLEGFRTAQDQTVRLSLATTLIGLDSKVAATDLFKFAQGGSLQVMRRIEPALARWRYSQIVPVWLSRLEAPTEYSDVHVLLAVAGVKTTNEEEAVPALLQIVNDGLMSDRVRIAAADALGHLVAEGLFAHSIKLLADQSPHAFISHSVAVRLLGKHEGPDAEELLLSVARNKHSTVAAIAVARLLHLNAEKLHPLVELLMQSRDPEVRRLAIESRYSVPDARGIVQLASALKDRHPDVRNFARESLLSLGGQYEYRELVLEKAVETLEGEDWRGLEQAARLLGQLNHKQISPRLVELLRHPRGEVHSVAAWGIRELAVTKSLAPALQFANDTVNELRAGGLVGEGLSASLNVTLACLFEFFGRAGFMEAEPLLTAFVPKRRLLGAESRRSAIWALGLLYTDNPHDALVEALAARASDVSRRPPEFPQVRAAAAVALGRMKATSALGALAAAVDDPGTLRTRVAARWAIAQIKGSAVVPTEAPTFPPADPFLRSL